MKKLMIALAAGMLAVGANAASINWTATKGYLYDGGDTTKVTSGTAYLVLASYSQDDLVSAFAAANGDAATTIATISTLGTGDIGSNARIASGTGTTTSTSAIDVYFVVFNDDKMYISGTATSEFDGLQQEHTVGFASITASSKLTFQANDGYSAAGWYAVPEPTSGLLMLLGMAGLALRRKRA